VTIPIVGQSWEPCGILSKANPKPQGLATLSPQLRSRTNADAIRPASDTQRWFRETAGRVDVDLTNPVGDSTM